MFGKIGDMFSGHSGVAQDHRVTMFWGGTLISVNIELSRGTFGR